MSMNLTFQGTPICRNTKIIPDKVPIEKSNCLNGFAAFIVDIHPLAFFTKIPQAKAKRILLTTETIYLFCKWVTAPLSSS